MFKKACLLFVLIACILVPTRGSGWVEDGVVITYASYGQRYPQIAYTGDGSAIIVWEDDRNYPAESTNIYAQRVDTTGTIHWVFNGMPVCRANGPQEAPRIAPDEGGGAYICWEDERDGNTDIYVQHMGSDGLPLWALNGIAVTTNTQDQYEPEILADGYGGVIIVWTDGRYVLSSGYNIYAQRYDADGNRLWGADGNAVCTVDYYQGEPKAVSDGEGGVFVVWKDGRYGVSLDDPNNLFMARLDANGIKLYEDRLIVWEGYQGNPAIVPVGDGSYIVAWRDGRVLPSYDIYAQRVSAGGTRMWSEDGAPICTADETQDIRRGASDCEGGAIFVWADGRSGSYDIYAGRIDSSAAQPWATNGVPVCTATGIQIYPDIVSDGEGGAVICWEDRRMGASDVYAQRILPSGAVLWTWDGIAVCDQAANQLYPVLCTDGEHGALITWMDIRVGDWDIFAALVNGMGDLVATLLESFTARAGDGGIVVEWRLSEMDPGMRFSIERAELPDDRFVEVAEPTIVIEDLQYTFEDVTALPGREYRYAVLVTDDCGTRELFRTGVLSMPHRTLILHQNHPNPFNPATTISYYLPEDGSVTLEIYDVTGRQVTRILDGACKERGFHSELWDGRDSRGREMASGIYIYRLGYGKNILSRKMLLLR
jgi:hypothetical protein